MDARLYAKGKKEKGIGQKRGVRFADVSKNFRRKYLTYSLFTIHYSLRAKRAIAFPGYLRVLTGKARNFYKEDN